MSYFDPDLTKKRASNVIGTPHLKKDVGVIEGFKAQRDNTYGVMEEQAIQNRAMGPVMDFVIENSGSRFTAPSSAEFTNDAWQALSRLKAEGVEVPERFAFDSQDDFFADALRQEAERYKERQSRVAKTTGLGGMGAP